jgi:hypothetical protein
MRYFSHHEATSISFVLAPIFFEILKEKFSMNDQRNDIAEEFQDAHYECRQLVAI